MSGGMPPFMMGMGAGMGAGMGSGMGAGMGTGMGPGMFGMSPIPYGQPTFGGMGLNAGLGCQSWEKDTGSCGIMGFCFDPKEHCSLNKRCCGLNGNGAFGSSGNGLSADTKSKLQEKLNKEQSKLQKIQEKIKKLQTAINQAG